MRRRLLGTLLFAAGIGGVYAMLGQCLGGVVADCIRCDAGWYRRIADHGYPAIAAGGDLGHWRGADIVQTEWAFFPLYPWLVRASMHASGLDVAQVYLLLGMVLSAVLALLAQRLFAIMKDGEAAFWGTLALLVQPFGIYFHLGMTEGLFLCALLGAFLAAAKRRPWALAFCATVLVLTRPNGLFLLPVFIVYAHEAEGHSWASLWKKRMDVAWRSWPLLIPVAAFLGWCFHQWKMTGDPFAFSAAQAGWGRRFTWPFMGFFNAGDPATQFDSWFSLGLLLVLIGIRKRLAASLNLLLWTAVLLPLFSGSVASMPRFATVLFPLFLLAGQWLAGNRWRVPILAASFLLQMGWFILWFHGELVTC